jgi:hypothetical protein
MDTLIQYGMWPLALVIVAVVGMLCGRDDGAVVFARKKKSDASVPLQAAL